MLPIRLFAIEIMKRMMFCHTHLTERQLLAKHLVWNRFRCTRFHFLNRFLCYRIVFDLFLVVFVMLVSRNCNYLPNICLELFCNLNGVCFVKVILFLSVMFLLFCLKNFER